MTKIYTILVFCLYQTMVFSQMDLKINAAEFNLDSIMEGQISELEINLEILGEGFLNPGVINIQTSFPYNSYISVVHEPPSGVDADYFEWTLDEHNFWNGINIRPLPADKNYEMIIPVIGLNATIEPQSCDIMIRAIKNLISFETDDPVDNYIQATLNVVENNDMLDYTNLIPDLNEIGVSAESQFMIEFSENIDVNNGIIQIRECETNYLHQQLGVNHPSVSVSGNTLSIAQSGLDFETCYYILISHNAIEGANSSNSFLGIHNPLEWRFTTADFCSSQPEQELGCPEELVLQNSRTLDNEEIQENAITINSEEQISGMGELTYNAPSKILLTKGFKATGDVKFIAQIGECEDPLPSFDVQVFLQGPLIKSLGGPVVNLGNSTGFVYFDAMRTDLVNQDLIPISSLADNPYRQDPWSYNTCIPTSIFENGLDQNITDWVLLELRSSTSINSTICQKVGLLYSDGSIEFPDGGLCEVDQGDVVYIVVKHRSHVPIISPPVTVDAGRQASYDFRHFNSIQGNGTIGQAPISNGLYAMVAGNVDQTNEIFSEYSIEINDWESVTSQLASENAVYNVNDVNMNG